MLYELDYHLALLNLWLFDAFFQDVGETKARTLIYLYFGDKLKAQNLCPKP